MSESKASPFSLSSNSALPLGMVFVMAVVAAVFSRGTTDKASTSKDARRFLETVPRVESDVSATARVSSGAAASPGINVLLRHFGLPAAAAPTHGPNSTSWESLEEFVRKLRVCFDCRIETIVTTISDPIDSHLQLNFDGQLSAMMRSAEQLGFVLDRYELTWTADAASKSPKRAAHATPSAVLLRRAGKKKAKQDELLLLLLVGETPTAGLHAQAFQRALDLAAAIHLSDRQPPVPPVQRDVHLSIVGPCYSGTCDSMRHSLDQWREQVASRRARIKNIHASIRSGSASGDANHTFFKDDARPDRRAERPTLKMSYSTCVHADSVTLSTLLRHLKLDRGIPERNMLLLVEANTAYGKSAVDAKAVQGVNPREIRQVVFPMALSRLRTAAQSEAPAAGGPLLGPSKRERHVPLTSDEPAAPIDVVPLFSSNAPVVSDVVIAQILSNAIRDDIRAIGIMGTDPRDKGYLASRIRRFAPDVLLFTVEADSLYTHSDYIAATEGMIVASSYPLFARSQRWLSEPIPRPASEVHLNSDIMQGVYNATLSTLGEKYQSDVMLVDYKSPKWLFAKRAELEDSPYRNEEEWPAFPPVWLLTSHVQGFWPVAATRVHPAAVKDLEPQLYGVPRGPSTVLGQVQPPSMYVSLWFTCVNLIVLAILILVNFSSDAVRRFFQRGSRRLAVSRNPIARLFWRLLAFVAVLLTLRNVQQLRTIRHWLLRVLPAADLSTRDGTRHGRRRRRRRSFHFARFCALATLLLVMLTVQTVAWTPVFLYQTAKISASGHSTNSGVWDRLAIRLNALLSELGLMDWLCLGVWLLICFTLASLTLIQLAPNRLSTPGDRWKMGTAAATAVLLGFSPVALAVFFILVGDSSPIIDLIIALERIGTYRSDVTPLVPLVLLATALAACGLCRLRLQWLSTVYPLENPLPTSGAGAPSGIASRIQDLARRLGDVWFWPSEPQDWLVMVLAAVSIFYVSCDRWIPTVETRFTDWAIRFMLIVGTMFLIAAVIRIKSAAGLFVRVMRRVAQTSIMNGLDRVPLRTAQQTSGHFFAASPDLEDLEACVRKLDELCRTAPAAMFTPNPRLLSQTRAIVARFDRILCMPRALRFKREQLGADLRLELANAIRDGVVPMTDALQKKIPFLAPAVLEHRAKLLSTAEEVVAIYWVDFIRQVFAYMRTLAITAVVVALLLLWSVNSYPFLPRGLLNAYLIALILWTVVSLLSTIIKFNRDEVLSRLSRSEPNQFTWDRQLVLQLVTFGVLPVLSTVSLGIPSLESALFSWVHVLQQLLRT